MSTMQLVAPAPPSAAHPVPAGIDVDRWLTHLRSEIDAWLADFTWDGRALTEHVDHLSITLADETEHLIWDNKDQPRPLPELGTKLSLERSQRMYASAFENEWYELIDAFKLAGTWVHPDILFEMDPLSWRSANASIPVGCRDQADPDAPRRFDAAKAAWSNDLGVVLFPLRPYRCIEWMEEGHSAATASHLVAVTALAEAGVHEAMELFDLSDGKPAWTPHQDEFPVTVNVYWATVPGQPELITGNLATGK